MTTGQNEQESPEPVQGPDTWGRPDDPPLAQWAPGAVEDRLGELERVFRRRPRSPERRVAWAEARIARLEHSIPGLEHAAAWSALRVHRLRWLPWGAEARKAEAEMAKLRLREAKARLAVERQRLERLRERAERRRHWDAIHAAEARERAALVAERTRRQADMGARAREAEEAAGVNNPHYSRFDRDGGERARSSWEAEMGEAAWRRAARERPEQDRQQEQHQEQEHRQDRPA